MKVKKVNNTFDTYSVEMSFTDMQELLAKLEADHSGRVADDLYQALRWYLDHVPGPGEDADEAKEKESEELAPGPEGGDAQIDKAESPEDLGLEAPPSEGLLGDPQAGVAPLAGDPDASGAGAPAGAPSGASEEPEAPPAGT